ncbi:leucyl/phenylalanyl-tRNA protein transferase, putative [Bodo saltans]|uniref:Leucyl/phenylalanyl-tRNA protein transferase, putative n=1 Tax=Bodo saltans TaxID=75058 RepID=A0A0S4JJJ8_BODSA|nr:leucyl/phenylalanyl-tRNA protein transferase, putative [Bodo saltans]|eukprot:CUG90271.1 leucyl/phenylalanyl-tRNA protein transferase, putative [Bodo saltans]
MAFRIDAYDSFLQLFANKRFEVVSFAPQPVETAKRRTSAKKKKSDKANSDDEIDPDDTPEQPLHVPLASHEDLDSGLQKVALVSLRPNTSFHISVRLTDTFDDEKHQDSDVLRLTSKTTLYCKILSPRSLLTEKHFHCLTDEEMIRVLVLHPSDWMTCLIEWKQKRNVQSLMSRLYYDGLFTISSTRHDFLLSIPNGNPRYGIDFEKCTPGCWTHSKKVRRLLQGKITRPHTPSTSDDVVPAAPSLPEQQRGDCSLRVVVNRNFEDTMNRALAYHTAKGGTWMTDSLIKAMSLMSAIGSAHGVRLCAVELWDVSTNELLAGCLGFALGSVYHDFTMFTCVRSDASYGSLITKVLAAALHDCGYRLWYWGFRVDYMSAFEGRYGACEWPRDQFYELWAKHRAELPLWHVMEYLNEGKGLLKQLTL